jgi:YD repeat-containing protein
MAIIVDNFSGTPQEGRGLTVRMDYGARTDGQPIFVGWAPPGKATSDAVWKISQQTYDANNQMTSRLWADGDTFYDNVWDNRAGLTYI